MSSATIHNKKATATEPGRLEVRLKEVSDTLSKTWTLLSNREHYSDNKTISLPYNTKRYMDEVDEAFELSYGVCPVSQQQKSQLKQIEIECHALQAALNAREFFVHKSEVNQVKPILIALRVLFKEFKEDRMQDGKARLNAFVRQLHKLVMELPEIFSE
jgi:hypothetical protein